MHVSAGGMRAGQTLVDVAGHNTANLATEDFRPQRAEHAEAAPGVQVAAVTQQDGPTDLAEQAGNLVVGRALYGANARALVVDSQTRGLLLDVRA
jgi:flagellar basal body rod protein FlgG